MQPSSNGIGAFVTAIRRNRTRVHTCSEGSSANTVISKQRQSTSVGTIGGSLFRRLRKSSTRRVEPSACKVERENAVEIETDGLQNEVFSFPLLASHEQQFLQDVFESTCDSAPPALAACLRNRAQLMLGAVFAEMIDALQDSIQADAKERLEVINIRMASWTNQAQQALASSMSKSCGEAHGECGPKAVMHTAEFIVFALQLKLQAISHLMNNSYMQEVQKRAFQDSSFISSPVIDASSVCRQHGRDAGQHGDQDIDLSQAPMTSSTVNTYDLRKEYHRISQEAGKRGDMGTNSAILASSAINASIFRRECDRLHARDGETQDIESCVTLNPVALGGMPTLLGSNKNSESRTRMPPFDKADNVTSLPSVPTTVLSGDSTPRFS